ncbi:MAG: IS66 family transposase [Gammaproteobacteria bacterium]|nr:MAG: IS66 family transposase [Gammaproteobacteria bacterium]
MPIKPPKDPIEITAEQAGLLISKVKNNDLDKTDQRVLCQIILMFLWLQYALRETRISLKKIKKLVFGQKSEKQNRNASNDTTGSEDDNKPSGTPQASDDGKTDSNSRDSSNSSQTSSNQTGGSGRLGTDAYTGAETIHCTHPEHQRGDICPRCEQGSLFKMKDPGKEIRLFSQGLIQAIIYFLERYRCSACGAIFKAPMPEDVVNKKYDDSAKVALAIMHYYMGLPFKRIELYQQMMGIPLPDATQFELVESVADVGYRIYEYMKHCAADSQLAYHDDTTARILSMIKENQQSTPKRKAMYTTAMVFEGEHPICLFVTGRQHAGENLDDIIDLRDETLEPIMQMSDGLAANQLKNNDSLWINCIIHGRRNFIDIESVFPEECHYAINAIGKLYHHEAQIKEQGLNAQQRLEFHQKHSRPIMDEFQAEMHKQLDEHQVEENSRLGGAYNYMLKRWDKLTRFLHIAGAPLDNNTAERAIKSLIRYRNNSLFFKNEHGAYIADVIISLVETCRMNGQNPEDYLRMLMKNKSSVFAHPEQWLPWNYKDIEGMKESEIRPPVGSRPGSQRIQDFHSTTECVAC